MNLAVGQPSTELTIGGFSIESLRAKFPALEHAAPFVFFDNAAGAQIPRQVFDAVNRHLLECNVQRGGRYPQSQEVDATISRGRQSVADFVNARSPNEIAFGMNATSFIRIVSLAIGQTLAERNEIVVTDMDHEANIATWLALERDGAKFRWWKMRDDGNLYADDLREVLSPRTRLVAGTVTSNAFGSVVDVAAAAKVAHAAGAELFLDCVHFGPHGVIDVREWDCDYLVCSGYKIFAPHMGFLWGKEDLLRKLPTFREDFIPNEPPLKIEAGTFVYENVAGMDAAISYLASLGEAREGKSTSMSLSSRRGNITRAMKAIRQYEETLSLEMLRVLDESGATVYGISTKERVGERVPTLCFNLPGIAPADVTEAMSRANIGIRDGHLYSPRLMKRLGLSIETGAVRASLVHYNTIEEIHRFGNVLLDLSKHA
jgi:cysteine desulfurase family protein (TIGR01976 family)